MIEIEEVEAILKELKSYGATDQQIADYLDTNRVIINRLRNGRSNRGETGVSYLPTLRNLLASARASKQSQQEASIVDSLPTRQYEQDETRELRENHATIPTSRAIDILRSQQIDIAPQWIEHVVMPQSRELQPGEGYKPDTGYTYTIQEIPSRNDRAMAMVEAGDIRRKRQAEISRQGQLQTGIQGGYGRYCRVCGLHPIGTLCSYR